MPGIHHSPFSGSWYPEAREEAARLLDECWERSGARTGSYLRPGGLAYVVPHAGPMYSGAVAASVYRALARQQPERIFVLAFPHRGGLAGTVSPDVEAIRTPFGDAAIDRGPFPAIPEDQVCDHSFEIQLPFLQRAAPKARITPVYIGSMSAGGRRAAADTLAGAWRAGDVFLASSDFTHYGRSFGFVPFPADGTIAQRLRELDFECIDAAGTLDAEQFVSTLRKTGATVCGRDAIALLLEVLQRLQPADILQTTLDYQTSGEITGDYQHSVSYAALGYHRRDAFDLGEEDRAALLEAARRSLRRLRETGRREAVTANGGTGALEQRRAAFVSLHQEDELLGCVGNLSGRLPLAQEIPELALAAALDDPRFHTATLPQRVAIEVSLLTPFRRIRNPEECEPGRHGVLLQFGSQSGLLLPQVAVRHQWTSEQFLEAVARKALTGRSSWRDPRARVFVFEAQVFAG